MFTVSSSATAYAPPFHTPDQHATSALVPTAPVPVTPVLTGSDSDTDPLGDEIALLCAHITAATYRLLCLLKVYDEEERWQGFLSCAHWLSWRTGISLGPAREKVRVARCLPSLSRISEAFAKGEISYSKARAMTRIANPENEVELLTFARHGTTAQVERLVREWRRLDQGDASQAARAERRGLSVWLTEDGSCELRGRLNPEVGALLLKALEVGEARLYRAERSAGIEHETSAAQRRADALGLWLEERVQPQVQLVVHSFEAEEHQKQEEQGRHAPALLVTEEGSRVSAETSSRLACDADVVPIARAGDGSVLDVGRRRRTVGWRLRKALEARDGGCRFPGCESSGRTHAHHITPWAHGGETAMNNLVLLCPFHHRRGPRRGLAGGDGRVGSPALLQPLGRSAARAAGPLGHWRPGVPRRLIAAPDVLGGAPEVFAPHSRWPPRHRRRSRRRRWPTPRCQRLTTSVWPAGTARKRSVPGPEPRFGEVSGLTGVGH